MFEGKNKRINKILAHLMCYGLVFALFNHGMMLGEDERDATPIEQPQIYVLEHEPEAPYTVEIYNNAEMTIVYFFEEMLDAIEDEDIDIIGLGQDIELTRTLDIPKDAEVAINGNGHQLIFPYINSLAIYVQDNASLLLENIEIVNDSDNSERPYVDNTGILVGQGVLTLGEGSVVSSFTGGGIAVYGGTLVLDGGAVLNNGFDGYGGGVFLNDGELIMHNGDINGNQAWQGGGIFAQGASSIAILGGQIHGNAAYQGGGLYLAPPTQGAPNPEGILIEFGEDGLSVIFDNHSNADYWPIADEDSHGDGFSINDGAEFVKSLQAKDSDDDILPFDFILPPSKDDEEIFDKEDTEEEEKGIAEADVEDNDDTPQDGEQADEPKTMPQNSLADLMVTNPQTGDEYSFWGLVISAASFVISIFLLLVYREKHKLEKYQIDCAL